jgi:hypothetical protein
MTKGLHGPLGIVGAGVASRVVERLAQLLRDRTCMLVALVRPPERGRTNPHNGRHVLARTRITLPVHQVTGNVGRLERCNTAQTEIGPAEYRLECHGLVSIPVVDPTRRFVMEVDDRRLRRVANCVPLLLGPFRPSHVFQPG